MRPNPRLSPNLTLTGQFAVGGERSTQDDLAGLDDTKRSDSRHPKALVLETPAGQARERERERVAYHRHGMRHGRQQLGGGEGVRALHGLMQRAHGGGIEDRLLLPEAQQPFEALRQLRLRFPNYGVSGVSSPLSQGERPVGSTRMGFGCALPDFGSESKVGVGMVRQLSLLRLSRLLLWSSRNIEPQHVKKETSNVSQKKGCGEHEIRGRKPTCPLRSRALTKKARWGSMFDEDRYTEFK